MVEINEDVIALRDHFFVPKDDDRFRVIHDDGARYVETLKHEVDVVLVDAFDAEGIAASLPQSQFYLRAVAQLSRRGVLVMNFSGDGERYVDNVRASREAFRNHVVLVPVMATKISYCSHEGERFLRRSRTISSVRQTGCNLDFSSNSLVTRDESAKGIH